MQIWRTALLLNRTLYLLFQVAVWNEQLFCTTRSDIGQRPSNHISPLYELLLSVVWLALIQFRMGFFGAAHGWRAGGQKGYTLPKEDQKNIRITWHTPWVLLTSAFFRWKSANFVVSRKTDADFILIHNFYFFQTFLSL